MKKSHKTIESTSAKKADRITVLRQFSEVFAIPAPPRMSLELAQQNVVWAEQAVKTGVDPKKLRSRLLQKLECAAPNASRRSGPKLQPGARLIREWRGDTYEVTVAEAGFNFAGKQYKSLSEIATQITGSRWSGPRFFGLLNKTNGSK